MAGPRVPYEVRAQFFELMCGGWSLSASAAAVGVATSATPTRPGNEARTRTL